MNVNDIEEATADGPTRLGFHSIEGFGKTTLAAFFPRPVFIAPENGFPRDLPFRPRRFPTLARWEDCFAAIESLTEHEHDRETLAIDTVDWLEPLIHAYVCHRDSGRKTELNKGGHKLESIEDYGYGKGYVAAKEEWQRFLQALDLLQHRRGMHIVLLLHSKVSTFSNPSGPDYDRWIPKVDHRIGRLCIEWCENVVFGHYEIEAGKIADEKKAKGVSTGRRLLGTRQTAMYDAKNRMKLPPVMELLEPDDMIPCLLGEHLADETPSTRMVTDRSGKTVQRDARHPAPPDRREEARGEPHRATGQDRADARENAHWGRDESTFEADAGSGNTSDPPAQAYDSRTSHRPSPEGTEGLPAHHPDRQADEDRRRTEALDRAAGRNGGPDPLPRRDRVRDDAGLPDNGSKAVDKDRLARLTDALTRASKHEDNYRATVDGWLKKAANDPARIDAIISRILRDTRNQD